jgi:dipeptide transport system permease protein
MAASAGHQKLELPDRQMLTFFFKRLLLAVPTFIVLMFITFYAIRLVPGDPIEVRTGERGISPERLAEQRTELGLDQPVWRQFLRYGENLLQGDFGVSISTKEPVLKEFMTFFPATIELTFSAMLLAMVLGIPIGVIAAARRGGIFDHGLMTFAVAGYSMPIFWWGLLLVMLVSVQLGWTPVDGRIDPIQFYIEPVTGFMLIDTLLAKDQPGAFLDALHHLLLPTIVLATVPMGAIARMTRSSMLEVMGEDYVRTARAKGLPPRRVVGIHALRNALIPVITSIGLQLGQLLAGAVLTETIFSWPGVGRWLIESINRRDYPVLQGGILLVSTMVIIVTILVDVLYGLINPRVRHG